MKLVFSNSGPQISLNDINKYCKQNNINLPEEYKDFLINTNGGIPNKPFLELRKFDPNESNTNIYIQVLAFFQLEDLEGEDTIYDEEFSSLNLLPIAEINGGMDLCCKIIDTKLASISYFDFDFGELKIADSLDELFSLLIHKEEVDFSKYGFKFRFPE